jgi:NTE family protein
MKQLNINSISTIITALTVSLLSSSISSAAPKVAVVLSGGGAKGAAHIGVLRALEEAGVPIDEIAGTSSGAIVGGLYASGFEVDTLEEVISNLRANDAAEFLLPFEGGLLDADPLEALLDNLLQGRQFSDTRFPFRIAVTELGSNKMVTLEQGALAKAIHASMAIPGLFYPVQIGDKYYFDGGLKATIPAALAKSKGADYVIASGFLGSVPYNPQNVFVNLGNIGTYTQQELNREQFKAADQVVRSNVSNDEFFSFEEAKRFAKLGYQATQKVLPQILADLQAKGIPLRTDKTYNQGQAINRDWQSRMRAGRTANILRSKPFNVALEVDLEPNPYFGDARPSGYGNQNYGNAGLWRFGVRGQNGFLQNARVALGYAHTLEDSFLGDLRLEYRPDQASTFFAKAVYDSRAGQLSGSLGGTWRWDDFEGDRLNLGAALRFPDLEHTALELNARYRLPHFSVNGDLYAPLALDYLRGTLELRGTLPLTREFKIHARGFAGYSSDATPVSQQFSLSSNAGLRGYSSDLVVDKSIVVGNLELAWEAPQNVALFVTSFRPSVWTFADLGYAPKLGHTAFGVGVGAGMEGSLIGFFPVHLGLDLGYGLERNAWQLALRTKMLFP